MTDKTVVITGASSGIGAALAREWASRGANVVLLARRADRLDGLATELSGQVGVLALACDVTDPAQLDTAAAKTLKTFGRIDVVVANAGFGVVGRFEKLSLDDYRRQFETNVFGVLATAKSTLDALRASRGCLVIIGSVNSFLALPGGSPYAMSKYAVRALAESLYQELSPQGVGVTLIAPGFVDSEIRQVDNRGRHKAHRKEPIPTWLRMPTAKAARKIVRATLRRRPVVVITMHAKVGVFIARHMPWLLRLLLRSFGVSGRAEP